MKEQIPKSKVLEEMCETARAIATDWVISIANGEDRHPYHTDQMYMLHRLVERTFKQDDKRMNTIKYRQLVTAKDGATYWR